MIEVDGLTKRQGSKAATRDLTFLSVGLFTSSLIRDQAVAPLLGSGAMRILWLVDVAGRTSGLPASDIVTYVSSSTLYFDSLTGIIDTRDVIFHLRGDGRANCRTAVVAHAWTVDQESRLKHRCCSAQRGTAQDAAPIARWLVSSYAISLSVLLRRWDCAFPCLQSTCAHCRWNPWCDWWTLHAVGPESRASNPGCQAGL